MSKYVWHGTSEKIGREIEKVGVLKPRASFQGAGNWSGGGFFGGNPSNPNLVYITPEKTIGINYMKDVARKHSDNGALITAVMDWDSAVLDEDFVFEEMQGESNSPLWKVFAKYLGEDIDGAKERMGWYESDSELAYDMKEVAEMAPKVLSAQDMKNLFEQSATVASNRPLKVVKVEYFTPQGRSKMGAPKVERTERGSKNDYRITYDTGSQKWTNDRPGDGIGRATGELLEEELKDPAVQRGLDSIADAIKNGGNVEDAVNAMVRDTGTERGRTVLNAVYQGMKDRGNDKAGSWENARDMVANLNDVVNKIFDAFPVQRATEIAERLVQYWKTKNDKLDLTPQEQSRIYRRVDYGDTLPLSRKKKLDIDWTNHSEYRSDLRDIDPDMVNEVVRDRLRQKLNPPQKNKLKFKEPGLGTMVVDFDTTKKPADADVITVWGSENFYNESIAKELKDFNMNIANRVAERFQDTREIEKKFEKGVDKAKKLSGVDPMLAKFLVGTGLDDGDAGDDKISVSKSTIAASNLKPSQTTIRLEQVVGMALFMLQTGQVGGDLEALISGDNHILDGHHRWAAAVLAGGATAKVGGFQAKMAGKDLIKVLNIMTKGEYGRQRGQSGSGNIADVTPGKVRKLLEEYTTVGISGEFPKTAETVRGILEKGFGSVEAGIDILSENAKKVSKKVPGWASNRSDMPVIKPQEAPGAANLLNQGKINWNHPFVTEDTDVPSGLVAKVANGFMTDKLVTAEDMENYCSDCADKIRNGDFEMTWGELREMLGD
jgi:hypothetical protein